jgi:hypothetical protein
MELVFDDNQVAILVDGQQVKSLSGVVETVELLLDNQQFFTIILCQSLRIVFQPFLQMLALGEAQLAEVLYF